MAISLTIVVPVFNVLPYIKDALDSIRNQSKAPNEVIVIDDGSTDGTSELLLDYQSLPNWKVIKTKNNGTGFARNLGRSLADSEYVYFFDSDDILIESFVKRMHQVIQERNRPDLIMFAGQSFFDDGYEHPFSPSYQRTIVGQFSREDGLISKTVEAREVLSSACLYVSKTELWSKNRISFPTVLHEDEAVIFPLLAVSENTIIITDVFFSSPNSCSVNYDPRSR